MRFSTIISTDALAARLDEPSTIIVDVRSSLADPGYGARAYAEGHIPGAVYADLNRDLSDPPGGNRGRHPLPSPESMARTFGRLGISSDSQVVVYDDADGMYASRLWWMLRYLGHDGVAVLDGGFAKWTGEGRETSAEPNEGRPGEFDARPRSEMLATADDVEEMRMDARRILIDSRAPDRFRGENETIDPVGGHIPGARNRFFKRNVEDDGRLRSGADLESEFREQLGGREPSEAVVYCGSGVTACQNLLSMTHAGLEGAKLYAGSWSEWISEARRPIATGDDDDTKKASNTESTEAQSPRRK